MFTSRLTHCPHPKSTAAQKGRGTWESAQIISEQAVIVEVLSESVEAFDRGDKFANYQQLPTMQEYVIISQKRQRVECFRRNADRLWILQSYNPGSEIH